MQLTNACMEEVCRLQTDCLPCQCSFQKNFTGVNVLPSAPDSSALLEIYDEANLAITDSVIFNIPGNLMIKNSTVQVLRSSFLLNSGDAAGAMVIDSSQVSLHPCQAC